MSNSRQNHKYEFPLINTKIKYYQQFAYGLVIINLAFLLFLSYADDKSTFIASMAVTSTVLLATVLWDYLTYRRSKKFISISFLLVLVAIWWMRIGFYWMFVLNLFLWLSYLISRRQLNIEISDHEIIYPSFPHKKIHWQDVSNLVLKDDILTIDLKNNKIYQHHIPYAEKYTNTEKFNHFCKLKIGS